jgi:transposase
MKNTMLKGAHLSERKCREIIHLFCEDLTATQIAAITGVSRVTINAYVKLIRTRLALNCEANYPVAQRPANAISLTRYNDEIPNTAYYGFMRSDAQVFSTALTALNKDMILNWQRETNGSTSFMMEGIHAVADFTNWRLYRRDTFHHYPMKTAQDDLSGFWALTRNRLMKFRGLNRNTLFLHIKECEFRFNHRNEDLQLTLLNMINQQPLHQLLTRA